jgi:hypothetical protein
MSDRPADDDAPRIDWQTAEVSDGDLRVALAGEIPKRWAARFGELFDRLGHDSENRWGAAKVAKGALRVRDVADGSEADLRHELESAVLQANADFDAVADDGARAAEQSPEQQRDERMTAAFRDFTDGS